MDRLLAAAWLRGGTEEEKKVRQEQAEIKLKANKINREENQKLIEQGKANRKAELNRMLATLKGQKDEMVERRRNLKDEIKSISNKEEKQKREIEIRKID